MADSRLVHPLGPGTHLAATAAEPAGDPASGAPIFGDHLGCALHVLHLAVTAGMTCPCFEGYQRVGSWHEWPVDHLVELAGCVWYNISRSNTCPGRLPESPSNSKHQVPGTSLLLL